MSVGQTPFTQALLNPDLPVPDGLIDPQGRPAGKRFNVYRNNVIVSLLDAMETAFPVIRKLIGADNFRALSARYVRQHPPQSPLLMFYGTGFPEFLNSFEPLAHLPYLADVARLELARRAAYHAADATPVASDALAKIAPDHLMDSRFVLAPALRLVQSPYPIVAIWEYNMIEAAPAPDADTGGQSAMITRPDLDLDMQSILPEQACFLNSLGQNQTLGTAFEAASQMHADFDLSAAIVLLLQAGLITQIT